MLRTYRVSLVCCLHQVWIDEVRWSGEEDCGGGHLPGVGGGRRKQGQGGGEKERGGRETTKRGRHLEDSHFRHPFDFSPFDLTPMGERQEVSGQCGLSRSPPIASRPHHVCQVESALSWVVGDSASRYEAMRRRLPPHAQMHSLG